MTTTQTKRSFEATQPKSSYDLVQLESTDEAQVSKIVLDADESDTLTYLMENEDQIFSPTISKYHRLTSKVRIMNGK